RSALRAERGENLVAAGKRSGMGNGRALSRLAAAELQHDDRLRACRPRERGPKARSVLDALNDADDDLRLGVIRKPFQIIRRINRGFVATGDQSVEAKRPVVAELYEGV